jgi:hypothetical protein
VGPTSHRALASAAAAFFSLSPGTTSVPLGAPRTTSASSAVGGARPAERATAAARKRVASAALAEAAAWSKILPERVLAIAVKLVLPVPHSSVTGGTPAAASVAEGGFFLAAQSFL